MDLIGLDTITALAVSALASVAALTHPDAMPAPAPAAPTSAASSAPSAVDLQTFDGRWLVPDVEGGLTLVDDRADAELPTSWLLDGATGRIVSTATVDGRSLCLTEVRADRVLTLDLCGEHPRRQVFDVGVLDRADEVGISSPSGLLIATPDGPVQTGGSPDSPATVFRLV